VGTVISFVPDLVVHCCVHAAFPVCDAMRDLDVIPTPGTYSVVVMHYLELNGAITLDFTPGSNVEQILMQFSKSIYEQPSLHTEYLLHHSWLPLDYFTGALLLDNLQRVEGLPLFLQVYNALEARFFWGSQGKLVLFLYLLYYHLLSAIPDLPRGFSLKLQVSMSEKGRSPELNSFV
jgi:hypothetical protein